METNAIKYNLKDQRRNDSFKGKKFTFERNGNKDITGFEITAEFKYGSSSGPANLTLTIGNGITVTDAVNGAFEIDVIELVTLPVGRYYFDVKIKMGNITTTYVYGFWNIFQD